MENGEAGGLSNMTKVGLFLTGWGWGGGAGGRSGGEGCLQERGACPYE